MKPHALLGEIKRDVVSGTSRTLVLWLSLSLIVIAFSEADGLSVARLIHSARQYRSSGAVTLTITAPDTIDANACDALAAVPGIQAAGALRESTSNLTLASLPGIPVPIYQVSTTFPQVVGADREASRGAVFPRDVLTALAERPHTGIVTTQGVVPVAGVYQYPADGRRAGFGWAALVPSPTTKPYDECWASAWPETTGLRQLLYTTLDIDSSIDLSAIQISQLNTRLGFSFDGPSQYRERITAYAPVLSAIAGLLIAIISVRLRRLELAARLHDGAQHQDLQWLILAENASWSLPALLAATATGLATAVSIGPPDEQSLTASAAVCGATAVLGAVLGGAIAVRMVRESLLFSYFKDR